MTEKKNQAIENNDKERVMSGNNGPNKNIFNALASWWEEVDKKEKNADGSLRSTWEFECTSEVNRGRF